MPLDGLSFSNSGLFKITTPVEVALQAEQASQVQAETSIKKPEENEKVKPDVENNDQQERDLQGRDSKEEEQEEDADPNLLETQEKIKKYKVKFNQLTDMVELIDQKTGTIIETISPDDLINLISKTVKPSGILVDKEI